MGQPGILLPKLSPNLLNGLNLNGEVFKEVVVGAKTDYGAFCEIAGSMGMEIKAENSLVAKVYRADGG
jgi:hypothetical protein